MLSLSRTAGEPREPAPEEKQVRARRWKKAAVKLALTLGALVWFAWKLHARQIVDSLAHLNPLWFGLAVGVYLVGQTLCAWKWSLLARPLGFRKPLRFYWTHYLGAMFPSLFLPTSVGGDLFRMLALSESDPRKDRGGAMVSVLADRGTGVLAMASIASLAAAAGGAAGMPLAMSQTIYTLCGALGLLFLLPFAVRPFPLWKRLVTEALADPQASKLRAAAARVLVYWEHPGVLFQAVGLSFIFQAFLGGIYLFLGRALGLPAEAPFYFIAAPIASLAALSPVTLNGLGERLAALIVLFAAVGMRRDQAVVFGLEWTALAMLSALFGGAVLLLNDRFSPADPGTE
jgi:uncharacterized membrane protein YbhN (UPF0104 family)